MPNRTANPARIPVRSTAIREVPGYPQTGKTAWRASNDEAFTIAAAYYNDKYHLQPGDAGYRTPEFMKAWAMVESGGEGDKAAFLTDSFQVNKAGDYIDKGNSKFRISGLVAGQKMTPATSSLAALEWLRFKSANHDTSGSIYSFKDDYSSLKLYNANKKHTRQSGVKPHYVWYVDTITSLVYQMSRTRK